MYSPISFILSFILLLLPKAKAEKTEMDSTTPSKWPFLIRDMLEEITRRLETRTEILHVRSVCSAWHSSVPPPPKILNLDGPPPKLPIFHNRCLRPITGHFLLKESTVYCLKPLSKTNCNNWFINIEEGDSGKVRLKDPFSRFTKIKNLGKIGGLPNKVIDLLDYRVREVGKIYDLEFVEVGDNQRIGFNELISFLINRVVVGRNKEGDFCVMAKNIDGKLGFWKMGYKDWAKIDDGREESHYVDIAFYNGRIYAVDYMGLTIGIDPLSLEVTQVASIPYTGCYMYLVNSFGDLFLIHKFHAKDSDDKEGVKPCLKVYKFNEEGGEWISVKGLGDRVMLLGDGFCFSGLAKDFDGMKRNCVYFADCCFCDVKDDDFPGWNAGLYDLEDDVARPLESIVGYSKIFWPPPTWIGQTPS